jgi:hypothetical protein
MKRMSTVSNLGALMVLCALGSLSVSSSPIAAQAIGGGAGAAQVDPAGSMFRSLPTMNDAGGTTREPFKIMENESPRPQNRQQQKPGAGTGAKANGVAVGDVNQDGVPDLVKKKENGSPTPAQGRVTGIAVDPSDGQAAAKKGETAAQRRARCQANAKAGLTVAGACATGDYQ